MMVNPARTRTVTNTIQLPGTGKPYRADKPPSIQLNVPSFIDGGTVEKIRTRYADIDDTGTWSVDLEVNADIDPAGTSYTVHEAPRVSWTFIVPAGSGTLHLRDILIVSPTNPDPMVAGVPLPGVGVPAGYVWTTTGGGEGDYAPETGGGGGGGAPSGPAGGALSGTYPNPGFAVDMATQAELDAEAVTARAAEASKLAKASNLSDLANAGTARTNLGLGTAAVAATGDFDAAGAAATAQAAAIAASQPLDSDLTAIAALTTTSYGRAFLALADAAAGRTALGLGTAATSASTAFDAAGLAAAAQAASQPLDSDLTAIGALTTTSFGRSFLALADAAAARTLLGLGTAATQASTAFDAAGAATTALGTAQAYTDTETTRATTAEGLKLAKASNLSDLANAATARANLGAAQIRDRGAWAATTAYLNGDVVQYGGNAYAVVTAHTSGASIDLTKLAPVGTPRSTVLEGTNLWAYGHSYMTTTTNWVNRLNSRVGFANVYNNGISGDCMEDVARRIGTGFGVGQYGTVAIEATVNDAQLGVTAQVLSGFTNGLNAAIAFARAGTKVENTDTYAVYTGTWTANTDADFSGGSNRSTTTLNDSVSLSVPGDRFQVVVAAVDNTAYGTNGATFTVTVDGVQYGGTYSTSNAMKQTLTAAKKRGPMIVDVTGQGPGYHNVVITKTDASGSILFFDCVLVPAVFPPQVVIVKDYAVNAIAQSVIDTYNAIIDAAVAGFPDGTVISCDPGPTHVSATMDSSDRLHPNGRGSEGILLTAVTALGSVASRAGLTDPSYAELNVAPAVVASGADNFTRANAADPGATSTGAVPWQVDTPGGKWGITSNQMASQVATTGGSGNGHAVTVETGRSGTAASPLTLSATVGSAVGGGLCFRLITDALAAQYFVWHTGGQLYRYPGPTVVTTVASCTTGDVMSIVLTDSTIVLKKNGTTLYTGTDSNYQTATRHGFQVYNSATPRWAAFSWT